MSKIDDNILRYLFENIRKGYMPTFGSPETECSKCMFKDVCGIQIMDDTCVGCLGGWKHENEEVYKQ